MNLPGNSMIIDNIFKKMKKKILRSEFCSNETVESVRLFLFNPNLKRCLKEQKMLFMNQDFKYMQWKPFFDSIVYITDW